MTNIHIILPCIAIGLAIAGLIKPQWPLVAVAVLLIGIDLLIKN